MSQEKIQEKEENLKATKVINDLVEKNIKIGNVLILSLIHI